MIRITPGLPGGRNLVIPENAGEKRRIAETFGARVILSDPMEGSDGAIVEAQNRLKKNPGRYFMPDQYNNPNNWKSPLPHHGQREIWEQTQGKIHSFCRGASAPRARSWARDAG